MSDAVDNPGGDHMPPKPIASMLESAAFMLVARIVLVVTFLIPGILQGVQFQTSLGDFSHFHINPAPAFVVLSIVTLVAGSVLVIIGGKLTWLGAGALGVYTGLTILIVHNFWTMQGADAVNEQHTALEHISLIGGLLLVAAIEQRRAGRVR